MAFVASHDKESCGSSCLPGYNLTFADGDEVMSYQSVFTYLSYLSVFTQSQLFSVGKGYFDPSLLLLNTSWKESAMLLFLCVLCCFSLSGYVMLTGCRLTGRVARSSHGAEDSGRTEL